MFRIDDLAVEAAMTDREQAQVQRRFATLGYAVFAKACGDTRDEYIECLVIDAITDLQELHGLSAKRLTVQVQDAGPNGVVDATELSAAAI